MRIETLAHSTDSMNGRDFCCSYFYYGYRVFLERKIKEKKTDKQQQNVSCTEKYTDLKSEYKLLYFDFHKNVQLHSVTL